MKKTSLPLLLMISALVTACVASSEEGDDQEDEDVGSSEDSLRVTSSFVARGTGYYPDSSPLEGGFVDRRGAPLRTLQQFLAGKASYVSVAMDTNAFRYGQHLRIKELEAKYGRSIDFRVVDTGGAFRGKGRTRIDICTANAKASRDATINGRLNIDVLDGPSSGSSSGASSSGASSSGASSSGGSSSGASSSGASSSGASSSGASSSGASGGRACANDGQCNPGNDGSGLICTASRCVPGCRTNAQCPGSKRCVSGQCS
ncbi:MAG: hypothetical protein KF795_21000 [Labilithrix sp.]|nr:hypothetical protein [Labilithrix sp.]